MTECDDEREARIATALDYYWPENAQTADLDLALDRLDVALTRFGI